MGVWSDVDGHRIQPVEDGKVLWEHDAAPGYAVARHMVSSRDGARWTVVSETPLTLSPSLVCDTTRGGCGLHGFVRDGHWFRVG